MCFGKDKVFSAKRVLSFRLAHYNGRVLAQVDGKMVKPPPERPLEGMITIHSEISPMASSDYEPGR